ncbi:NAD(P)/FAD-dependent oxidoreductase [Microbacterium sp. CIAB417]|uniref:FAD-dependent oxidoreductase n=1 Tax=Microbacterium sp. CIAB417 TaxID=2860287 RepID=UPI001FAC7E2C|nr:NAD(P)/FAD-dependent oxidoreductase [Microbacterium sp. CIAB417]
MLDPTPLDTQLAAQTEDRLRVLVVGAGMAGLTVAQLLRHNGLHPVLVDRMPRMEHPGYMLALMPLVDQVFIDLGIRERYREESTPLRSYRFRAHRGKPLRTDSLGELLSVYGDYNGIGRGELVHVLTANGCPITYGTTVGSAQPDGAGGSRVEFVDRDGAVVGTGEFDLVIGADGMHSRMRDLLSSTPAQRLDTGWAGWVAWADDLGSADLGEELWGDGFFLGVYPVKDRLGVFLGGPIPDLRVGPSAFVDDVRERLDEVGPRLSAALDAVTDDPAPCFWHLEDVRSERWVLPGGVLIGDAAAGFLPTAGIGAGMAMEAAWMLARMLSHADRESLTAVLAEWERIEKPRVESAQSNSRMLAKLMFRRGRAVAWLRETVMRLLSVRAALGPIVKLVAARPDPDAAAERVVRAG